MANDKPELVEVPRIVDTLLTDIPGRLRELADRIEAGEEFMDVDTCAIVVAHDDKITVMGYGHRSEHDTIGIVLMAGVQQCADNYR